MRRALLCFLLTGPLTVRAATQTQKNRCADAARELRSGITFTYEKRDVTPSEGKAASMHLKDVMQRFEHAKKLMDSTGEWSSKDPDLVDCVTQFNRYITYFEATKAKVLAASKAADEEAPVMQAAGSADEKRAVFVFAAVQLNPAADAFANLKPPAAKALYDSLAEVEEACKKAKPEGQSAPPKLPGHSGSVMRIGGVEMPSTLSANADWQCWVATHRSELAKRAIGNVRVTAAGYGNHSVIFHEIISKGAKWNGQEGNWLFDIASDEKPFVAKLKVALAEWYQAFGFPVPEGSLPGLDEQILKVREAVNAAAERNQVKPGDNHERSIENSARATVKDFYPKLSVVASWMDAAGWTVEQTAQGNPIDRFRSGQIVYRVNNDPWCRLRTFNWVEPHTGGGTFGSPEKATILEGVKVVKCP